jgi:hypothetical protein
MKRGGLGANIGNDDWQKAKSKQQTMIEFANNVKVNNNQRL